MSNQANLDDTLNQEADRFLDDLRVDGQLAFAFYNRMVNHVDPETLAEELDSWLSQKLQEKDIYATDTEHIRARMRRCRWRPGHVERVFPARLRFRRARAPDCPSGNERCAGERHSQPDTAGRLPVRQPHVDLGPACRSDRSDLRQARVQKLCRSRCQESCRPGFLLGSVLRRFSCPAWRERSIAGQGQGRCVQDAGPTGGEGATDPLDYWLGKYNVFASDLDKDSTQAAKALELRASPDGRSVAVIYDGAAVQQ